MKSGLFSSLVLLSWLIALLLSIEFGWRLYYRYVLPGQITEFDENVNSRAIREGSHPDFWQEEWREYKPNILKELKTDEGLLSFSTDHFGFRVSGEVDTTLDFIFIGGSTTVEGNHNEVTYPYLVGKYLLNQSTTYNAGVCGITSDHYAELLKRVPKTAESEIVIYQGINDLIFRIIPEIKVDLSWHKRLLIHAYFLRYNFSSWFIPNEFQLEKYAQQVVFTHFNQLSFTPAGLKRRLHILSFLAPDSKSLTKEEKRFLDFNLIHDWNTEFVNYIAYEQLINFYNNALMRYCRQNGHHFIDVRSNFEAEIRHFYDVCHMRSSGIEAKARLTAKALQELTHVNEEMQ